MPHPYIGADPEFAILDPKGKPVPAYKFGFPDKHHRVKNPSFGDAYADRMIRDGWMLEVNPNGTYCREGLASETRAILQAALKRLPPGHTIVPASAVQIRLADLADAPDDCKTFGCDPSWDAYTGEEKRPVIDAMRHRWRYGGGHMHFSNTEGRDPILNDPSKYGEIVKRLDLYVGVMDAVIFSEPDDFRRRRYYGQAGEYRPQRYKGGIRGLEYRVPSPKMWNHLALMSLYFGVGRWVIQNSERLLQMPIAEKTQRKIVKAINKGIGAEALLQTVPGFYRPETILALRQVPEIREFMFIQSYGNPSWFQSANNWRLPGTEDNTIQSIG